MSRIGLSSIQGALLADPILGYQSQLSIYTIPGGGDGQGLSIRTRVSSIPGLKFDDVLVHLHGVELKFAGMPKYSHSLKLTVLETRDLVTRTALVNWMNTARNLKATTGSYKSQYATTATLEIYDDAENVIQTIIFYGVYPESIDDHGLDGASSAPIEYGINLSYDYWSDSVESE